MDTSNKEKEDQTSMMKQMITCVISSSVVAPLNRVKVILQTQSIGRVNQQQPQLNGIEQIRRINKQEGLLQLWRGNGMLLQKQCLQILMNQQLNRRGEGRVMEVLECWMKWTLGSFVFHPIDLMRVRMQSDLGDQKLFRGSFDGLKRIIQNEGIKSLFSGYSVHWMSHLPFFTLSFTLFDCLGGQSTDSIWINNAGIATLVSRIILYPLETVTHRLMVNGRNGFYFKYKGILDCFNKIIKQEGIQGFYRGIITSQLAMTLNLTLYLQVYQAINELDAH